MNSFPTLVLSAFEAELTARVPNSPQVKEWFCAPARDGSQAQQLYSNGIISERVYLEVAAAVTGVAPFGSQGIPPCVNSAVLAAATRLQLDTSWMVARELLIWCDEEAANDQVQFYWTAKNVFDLSLHEVMRMVLGGARACPVLVSSQIFGRLLESAKLLDIAETSLNDGASLREMAEQPPTIELLNSLLAQANEVGASDIHIEAQEDALIVRIRVDGVLRTIVEMPKDKFPALASRVKLVAGLDIAEHRLPQDGRFRQLVLGEELDLRVSTLPSIHGETIVLRLLRQAQGAPTMAGLGFDRDQITEYEHWLSGSSGIVLVTGPTGSGKSTTLYAGLESINNGERKIITAEDPVEYNMVGINQIHAKPDIGLSFSSILRASLRQDPDVIMVGEIRDRDTASIAIQAALTGHLVLSTLHTNTAAGAAIRLLEMGIEPFLVAAPLRGLQAQRLIRTLCTACAKSQPKPATLDGLTLSKNPRAQLGNNWHAPVGCSECGGTGYSGRGVISEFITLDEGLRHAIATDATGNEFLAALKSRQPLTMLDDGVQKASLGLTTLDEVLRVCG